MEKLIVDQWQQWAFIKVIVVAILIYFVLRLLHHSLKIIKFKRGSKFIFSNTYPVLELIVWISFIFWSLKELFTDVLYYNIVFVAVILIFLAWIGWYAGRDYIAGIIWRSQNTNETGHKLILKDLNGSITKLAYLYVELEQNDGTLFKVPYTKIAGDIHSNKNQNKLVQTYTYSIEVTQEAIKSGVIENLQSSLLNSPWHVSYRAPHIKKVSEVGERSVLEIIFNSIGEEGVEKLKILINKKLAGSNR